MEGDEHSILTEQPFEVTMSFLVCAAKCKGSDHTGPKMFFMELDQQTNHGTDGCERIFIEQSQGNQNLGKAKNINFDRAYGK